MKIDLKEVKETRYLVLNYQDTGKIITTNMLVHCYIDSFSVLDRVITPQTAKTLCNELHKSDVFDLRNNQLQSLVEDAINRDFYNNKF